MKSSNLANGRVPSKVALALNFAQVRMLKVLTRKPGGMPRADLARAAGVGSPADTLGPINKEDLQAIEKRIGKKTLIGLGYVTHTVNSLDGPPSYRITKAGRQALETLNADPCWPFGH